MTYDFYSLIINNPIIIETLFHLHNYNISIINPNKRIINKTCNINNIFEYLPLLKCFFNNDLDINYIITETFFNNSFKYKIKLAYNPIFNNYDYIYKFRFYIFLSLDNINNNVINIYMKTNKKFIQIKENNPFNLSVVHLIIHYLENDHMTYIKNNILNNELKPLLSSLNPHSFELNII